MNAIEFNFVKKFNNGELEEKTCFTYKEKEYCIYCFVCNNGTRLYSVNPKDFYATGSMNIDKVTSKYISLYSFDMMNQRTTYKMALSEIDFK